MDGGPKGDLLCIRAVDPDFVFLSGVFAQVFDVA
jgi:hypothetical protein